MLLLGAVINVAVAWACVCWSDLDSENVLSTGVWPVRVSEDWPVFMTNSIVAAPDNWKPDSVLKTTQSGFGLTHVRAYACWPAATNVKQRVSAVQDVLSSGWPSRSLFYEFHTGEASGGSGVRKDLPTVGRSLTPGSTWSDGVTMPDWVRSKYQWKRPLPIRVHALGFAINTVVYAGVLALIWRLSGLIRQVARHRHGLCVECGYDLRGIASGVCPECGSTCKRAAPVR